jgi:hypothetical protein
VSAVLTVSDSKRAFHSAFPHVIAPLYRRMVDELLVELHLLSHQRGFQVDPLFACGLIQVFESFARGYRPDQHREPLFAALCSATGFDAAALQTERDNRREVSDLEALYVATGGGQLVRPWPYEVPLSLDDRKAAQAALAKLGFDPGAPDGVIGVNTRTALRGWQATRSLPADGYLSVDMVRRLRAEAGI